MEGGIALVILPDELVLVIRLMELVFIVGSFHSIHIYASIACEAWSVVGTVMVYKCNMKLACR